MNLFNQWETDIENIIIVDNGIGFDDENYNSFDTYASEYKIQKGCKGVGRMLWLKAFCSVSIESIFVEEDKKKCRTFLFDANHAVPFGLLRDCRFGFVGSPGIERLRCRNDYICRFVRAYRYVPPSVYHRSLYFDCDYSGLYFAGCRQTFVRRCSERTSPGVDRCRMVGTSVGHYLDRMRGRYRLFSELDFRFDSSRCGTYN